MNSSGIKRGLAITAVSALAVTGLASAAQARTIGGGGETALDLYSFQHSSSYSTANDGSADSANTVTLLAGFPNTLNVNTVRFTFTNADGEQNIATVVPIDGVATYEWTPPTGAAGDSVSAVTAYAQDASNATIATSAEAMNGDANPNANPAISLDGALRSDLGLNPDGEVVLRGLSALAPPANVGDNYTDVFGHVVGPRTETTSVQAVRAGNTLGSGLTPFAAIVAVDPTNLTADAVDEIVAEATNNVGNVVDDVNVYSVYDQVVTGVTKPTAAGHGANVAGDADGDGNATNDYTLYNLTVADQKGQPMSGVDIYESDESGADIAGIAGMGLTPAGASFNAGESNFNGQLQLRLNESEIDGLRDQDPAAGVGATYVVIDVNQNGTFQNGLDQIVKLTTSTLPTAPATVTITSSRGTAMDDDETTDLTFTVKDANGDPVPNFALNPTIARDVADNTPADSTTPLGAAVTDANGQVKYTGVTVGVNDNKVAVKVNATAGGATGTLSIETDEAKIVWDEGTLDQAPNGTSVTESGKVQLPSGTALAGRNVALTYSPSDNSRFAPNAEQPTGTVSGTPTTANSTSDANGKFSVKVTDPATPNGQEIGSTVSANAPALNIGGGETAWPAVLQLDFLRSLTPTAVRIYNDIDGTNEADGMSYVLRGENGFAADGTDDRPSPGGLGVGSVATFNADGIQLDDVDVPLTITEGNFVNQADPFDPAPAVGAVAGEWKSAGKTMTVSTNDGLGVFAVNIERNAGFDDDGLVADKVRTTIGGASDEHDFEWSTRTDPLNQGSFEVTLSEDQDSSILPKARAGEGDSAQAVYYDVVTTDQFGNRTQQDIDVTDNSAVADFFFPNGDESQFDLSNPAIVAYSEDDATQSLEVELPGATSYKYTDNPANGAFNITDLASLFTFTTFAASEQQEDTDAINWYTVDLNDKSLYTLTQEGSENVPVGSTVSYTLTATDPEGQPLNGIGVGFLRVGPGDEGQDDDGQMSDITNEDGEAFYDFAGSVPGIASVSAVVYDDEPNGVYHRLFVIGPDTVTFDKGPKEAVTAKLTGKSNGKKADKLTVEAPAAAKDAVVKLYKIKKGKRVLVETKSLNDAGLVKFSVPDKNGKAKTKYVAKVKATAVTKADETNTKAVK